MDAGSAAQNIVLTHGGAACLAVIGIQTLKKWKAFPLLQEGWTIINRSASMLIALATSLGITLTWAPTTSGGHHLGVDLPATAVLVTAFWHAACQWGFQEVVYQASFNQGGGNGLSPVAFQGGMKPAAAPTPPPAAPAAPPPVQ